MPEPLPIQKFTVGDVPWIRFGNVLAPANRVAYASIHDGKLIVMIETDNGNQCLAQDGENTTADVVKNALVI